MPTSVEPGPDATYDAVLARMRASALLPNGLSGVARLADARLATADGIGLALLVRGEIQVLGASTSLGATLIGLEFELDQGPCITAFGQSAPVFGQPGAAGETRWTRLRGRLEPLGVASIMSLPFPVTADVTWMFMAYAHTAGVFDDKSAAMAEHFGTPAIRALADARAPSILLSVVTLLEEALGVQNLTTTAVSVLRERGGLDGSSARRVLLDRALERQQPVALAAASIIGMPGI